MIEREINFQDKQGRKIVGTLIIPQGRGPFPIVILCHGFKAFRKQIFLKEIATEIAKRQIACLRIDFVHDPGESTLEFAEMTVSYELEVLDQAVEFVKDQPELDSSRLGLAGHSLGGLVVSWYTAGHQEIKSLVNLSAVYSFKETFDRHYADFVRDTKEKGYGFVYSNTLKTDYKLLRGFYDDGLTYEMDKLIKEIKCPAMVLCGNKDSLLNHSEEYFDKLEVSEKDFEIIEGADHNYTNPGNIDKVKEIVANWFQKTLA